MKTEEFYIKIAENLESLKSGRLDIMQDFSLKDLMDIYILVSGGNYTDFDEYPSESIRKLKVCESLQKILGLDDSVESVDYHRLVQGFQDYVNEQTTLCPDNVGLMEIFPKLLKLQNDKGRVYGRSYAKHGDVSIFLNVERKFDRISNIMDRAMREGTDTLHSDKSATATETFLDTVVDLGLYSLMWVEYIKEMYPAEWEQFLSANKL